MTERDISLYLRDIVENMRDAEEFVGGRPFEEFSQDRMAVKAVLQCLEVIGEAAKNVPAELQQKRPQVPWSGMARMRDRLIHMYFGIDHTRVWETVTGTIPTIRPLIESLLDELER